VRCGIRDNAYIQIDPPPPLGLRYTTKNSTRRTASASAGRIARVRCQLCALIGHSSSGTSRYSSGRWSCTPLTSVQLAMPRENMWTSPTEGRAMRSHMSQPAIVQGDRTVLLEVDHPDYERARDLLARFAELERSPEHVHTYRLSSLALWNAPRSASLSPKCSRV